GARALRPGGGRHQPADPAGARSGPHGRADRRDAPAGGAARGRASVDRGDHHARAVGRVVPAVADAQLSRRPVGVRGPALLPRAGPAVCRRVHCTGAGGTGALGPVLAPAGVAVSPALYGLGLIADSRWPATLYYACRTGGGRTPGGDRTPNNGRNVDE